MGEPVGVPGRAEVVITPDRLGSAEALSACRAFFGLCGGEPLGFAEKIDLEGLAESVPSEEAELKLVELVDEAKLLAAGEA